MNRQQLEERVVAAAESTLRAQNYVRPIDIFLCIGYLSPSQLKDWRLGKIPSLEEVLQGNLDKQNFIIRCFRQWAVKNNLHPSESAYVTHTRDGQKVLQFSKSGLPEIELAYRTHYLSTQLSAKKQQNLQKKMQLPPEEIVYCVVSKDAHCKQCHRELNQGSFLFLEEGNAFCLTCAGLDALVFLPSGNVKLTRRAKEYSGKNYAVVVQFSKARKRYERQGLLVEEKALKKAEKECETEA